MRSFLLSASLVMPLALAGTTTPEGPVAPPIDLRSAIPETARATLPVEPVTHRHVVPIGKDGAGEAEIVWGTAEAAGGAYVTDVSLVVTRAAEGYEVLQPVVLPPLNRGTTEAPLASVGVVVGWRKESACRGEMASVTFQIDGKGGWTAL
jgi:hypothetical protein